MRERPLEGLSVLVTRPREQADAWLTGLEAAGARALAHPTITVGPPPSWDPLDEGLRELATYDWLVFTSAAAVRFTWARLRALDLPLPVPPLRIAAVGPETAHAIEAADLRVSLIPDDKRQEGLLEAFADLRPGSRVLFPQALGGRPELRNELARRGCTVDVVPASQTVPIAPLPELPAFDVATFASPSALRAFVAGHGLPALTGKPVVALGATTGAACEALGLRPAIAAEPTLAAVIDVLARVRSA